MIIEGSWLQYNLSSKYKGQNPSATFRASNEFIRWTKFFLSEREINSLFFFFFVFWVTISVVSMLSVC